MAFYDLSHPVSARTPVFPGDEAVVVRTVADLARGDAYSARRLELGTHSGTHVDAPAHLFPDGMRQDQIPLDLWVGPALLQDLSALDPAGLGACRRLLLGGCPGGLPPGLSPALLRAGVGLLGIDGPSVDPVESDDLPCHRALLGAGLVLVENLRLEGVPRGPGILYCLPLAVEGGTARQPGCFGSPGEGPARVRPERVTPIGRPRLSAITFVIQVPYTDLSLRKTGSSGWTPAPEETQP